MNHPLKSRFKVNTGTVIEGKWHHHRYTIVKQLGFGATGVVYLARNANQFVALKMSDNGMSVTSEVNVLKSFAKVQGDCLGPSLLDVDDWIQPNGIISFYVMEYIQGPDLLSFIQQKGASWIEVLIQQLLSDLQQLHENGWVFGDLKPDNLIVTGPPHRIRCIDVGGTTIQGRAIKEFTEFFDRGYWGLGSRKADPGYDLFAVAMILMNFAYPNRFSKTTGEHNQLFFMLRQKPELKKMEPIIVNALMGKYASAQEMRSSMLQHIHAQPNKHHQTRTKQNKTITTRQSYVKKKKKGGFFETVFIVVIILGFYLIYIYGQIH